MGFGNGAVLVYERQIIQNTVSDASLGRVFGFRDALTAWAFALAFAAAGVLIAAVGPRTLLVSAGIGDLVILCLAAFALRGVWTDGREQRSPSATAGIAASGADAGLAGQRLAGGQHSLDLVHGKAGWLTLLDDMGDRRHDSGVELSTRVDR